MQKQMRSKKILKKKAPTILQSNVTMNYVRFYQQYNIYNTSIWSKYILQVLNVSTKKEPPR